MIERREEFEEWYKSLSYAFRSNHDLDVIDGRYFYTTTFYMHKHFCLIKQLEENAANITIPNCAVPSEAPQNFTLGEKTAWALGYNECRENFFSPQTEILIRNKED